MEQIVKQEVDDSVKEVETGDSTENKYEEKLKFTSSIAKPMASKKLTKKIYKCIKKEATCVNIFVLVVFAGDVFPIEIMCHLPIVCEDKDIPYCFTPSKQDIGAAMGVKRGSLMVLIKEHEEYQELYEEIRNTMITLSTPL
ncbi:H/ACA ribonucleoprotein complex subunit 2-like protein [Melipona quadrifasciata]|uniref:H/ACA ribonucleoprotein complex subunit 2-like protein n=1 Tax=Melipona quadrifasciata TaxID=166423 RepID=A0A0N0BK59_9HYME|nr:H/ACA ribonucleoprotein complex subunit 2-like protein [Melipona quadrifasciata]